MLDVLEAGDQVVGVLEADEEVGEVWVGAVRIAGLDRAVDDLRERDWGWFCRHAPALPGAEIVNQPLTCSIRTIVSSISSKVVRG